MTSEKQSQPEKELKRGAAGLFAPGTNLFEERGVTCDSTIALRVPSELKSKLKEMPDWQNLLRQYLVEMVGY